MIQDSTVAKTHNNAKLTVQIGSITRFENWNQ